MYQKIIIIGRLGRDPEMRYTTDGTPVTSFSVATDRKWTDASGQPQSRTTWFRVTAWRRLAETCNQFLKKGRMVFIEGEISEPKPYQGNDGTYRATLDVTANTVKFLSAREGGGTGEPGAPTPDADMAGGAAGEEDIPF
ncbi:MAG: single-stranded DNA-binding protein [Chloroflexi bacterium]|nr:single-stranded DNA-binding protein [Chloroflexota bacterium]